ncbi:MAG TPA: hypothetical protein VMR79_07780, partial [Verrucomicrobiae bacterium]|nr:hypothetical protein [Verrucomicrobiae bacterium]
PGALAGLEYAGRFGERLRLPAGWRDWLARWLGRGDLAGVSAAAVAAAALADGGADAAGGAPGAALPAVATRWIASPVELIAGLTRVHFDRRGIVRLAPAEQALLADSFHRTFAGSGLKLQPLGDGQFLAATPGIAAIDTVEPARCAGAELVVPRGPAAAPLLRLMAEIEMWLHGAALNQTRAARGDPLVTGLWLWGATGETLPAGLAPRASSAAGGPRRKTAAFGSDPFVAGLLHLDGGALAPLPEPAGSVFTQPRAERAVVVAELAAERPGASGWSLTEAAAALDGRLIRPALAALGAGSLGQLTLVANDSRIVLGRRSGWKLWRRPRVGLAVFA